MEQDKTSILPILQVSKQKYRGFNRQEQGPALNYFLQKGVRVAGKAEPGAPADPLEPGSCTRRPSHVLEGPGKSV